jgi:hypothetical protein
MQSLMFSYSGHRGDEKQEVNEFDTVCNYC